MSTPIHYIWSGPSPDEKHVGHDTIGPDLMRQKDPNQEIHFWCLDSEVERYQAYFDERHQNQQPIHVEGIESYIQRIEPIIRIKPPKMNNLMLRRLTKQGKRPPDIEINLNEMCLNLIDTLKRRADSHPNRIHKIQEWITIKDVFSFFIQLTEKGYIADTNILPDFQHRDTLKALNGWRSAYTEYYKGQQSPDPFLMFSPGDQVLESTVEDYIETLNYFLNECETGEEFFPQTDRYMRLLPNQPSVRLMITTQFVEHAFGASEILMSSDDEGSTLLRSDIGLNKRFYSSHIGASLTSPPTLHHIIRTEDNLEEFTYLLEKQPSSDPFQSYPCQDTKRSEPRTTSLIEESLRLKYKDKFSALLTQKSHQLDVTESKLLHDMQTLLSIIQKIYPFSDIDIKYESFEQFADAIENEVLHAPLLKLFEIVNTHGPLTEDSIENYLKTFSKWHSSQKGSEQTTLFQHSSNYISQDAREILTRNVNEQLGQTPP